MESVTLPGRVGTRMPESITGVSPTLLIPKARDAQLLLEEGLEVFISQAVPWGFCPRTKGTLVKAQS